MRLGTTKFDDRLVEKAAGALMSGFAEGMAEGRRRLREGASHSVWAYLDYEPQTPYENGIRQAGFAWLNQRHAPHNSDSSRIVWYHRKVPKGT